MHTSEHTSEHVCREMLVQTKLVSPQKRPCLAIFVLLGLFLAIHGAFWSFWSNFWFFWTWAWPNFSGIWAFILSIYGGF